MQQFDGHSPWLLGHQLILMTVTFRLGNSPLPYLSPPLDESPCIREENDTLSAGL